MKTAHKFHGAGNDFILIDGFEKEQIFSKNEIEFPKNEPLKKFPKIFMIF